MGAAWSSGNTPWPLLHASAFERRAAFGGRRSAHFYWSGSSEPRSAPGWISASTASATVGQLL